MRKIKRVISTITVTLIVSLTAQSVFAGSLINNFKNIFSYNDQKVTVKLDGKIITFPDAQPYVNEDDRTMVPVRFVSEALGCKVTWEDTNQLVTINKGTTRILLRIGENNAIVNTNSADVKKEFDTAAVLKNDRTMVPLRFVSETLGVGVAWDEVNNTVILRSDGTVEVIATPTPAATPIATPTPTPTANGGWTVGDKPDLKKKQIQVLNGMTLEIALADTTISKLMELKGLAAIYYSGSNKELNTIQYNEFHKDGAMDVAMKVEYSKDMKNIFFDVLRDSEETRSRLKSAIAIMFPDYPEMQNQIFDQIIAYKSEGSYLGYNLNENYGILVKKKVTTWSRDDDSMGVWCSVFVKN